MCAYQCCRCLYRTYSFAAWDQKTAQGPLVLEPQWLVDHIDMTPESPTPFAKEKGMIKIYPTCTRISKRSDLVSLLRFACPKNSSRRPNTFFKAFFWGSNSARSTFVIRHRCMIVSSKAIGAPCSEPRRVLAASHLFNCQRDQSESHKRRARKYRGRHT